MLDGQVFGWLRRKHPNSGWKNLRRRYCDGTWWPRDGEVMLFNPGSVVTTRYRPRGSTIRPVREGGMKKRAGSNPETALHVDPTTTST